MAWLARSARAVGQTQVLVLARRPRGRQNRKKVKKSAVEYADVVWSAGIPCAWSNEGPPPRVRPGRRIGIVGAGRTRQGLGPYLARAFLAAGQQLVGITGRDAASTERTARELAAELGVPVAAFPRVAELAAAVDLLVVAAPPAAHAAGLQAALAAGVPCLCEKPLLPRGGLADALRLIGQFAARGLLLEENCQWPLVLPTLARLHPALAGQPLRQLRMGLAPAFPGPVMLEDSLSHLLSMLQALAPTAGWQPERVQCTGLAAGSERATLQFAVQGPQGPIEVGLELRLCPAPPRPAFVEINGCRSERRIGPGYVQSFVAGEREQIAPDPLQALVYAVLATLEQPDLERTATRARALADRQRCYDAVLAACLPGSAPGAL